jgi:dTDP-4-dehydrorhamnose 3,5-epimerase
MEFRETPLDGVYQLLLERHEDERGYFARTWCTREFLAMGLPGQCVQASISHNARAGTVRGLHFQWPPSVEAKLVRCEQGAVLDVVLDLRPGSPTYLRHIAVRLDAVKGNALYIPHGCAHGFQVLEDQSRVFYMMSDYFAPELASGVRFNDPAFGIVWPMTVTELSDRDRDCPDFDPAAHAQRMKQASI